MSRAAMPRLPAVLQRIAHTEGDLLRAHDLNAGLASEDELRWWHNRAFHEPYGIALGLSVTIVLLVLLSAFGPYLVPYDQLFRASSPWNVSSKMRRIVTLSSATRMFTGTPASLRVRVARSFEGCKREP